MSFPFDKERCRAEPHVKRSIRSILLTDAGREKKNQQAAVSLSVFDPAEKPGH
jgi:phage baseplate assembly protein W